MRQDAGAGAPLFDTGQVRHILAAVAVEQHQFIPGLQPHHVHVVGHGLGQVDGRADVQGLGAVKTGHAGPVAGVKANAVILIRAFLVW
jgi:hypothetical protein